MFEGALIVAVIAVVMALGLCLVHGDDHAIGGDLCVSFVAAGIGLLPALPLAPTGSRLLPARVRTPHLYSRDLPAPPPKTPLFS